MAEDTVTSKRLIISGLTPSIDANALSQRLSSFGEVHSLVGVGMLDANGDPRKFAHLTMDTTKAKLSRCIQAFTGSTWKGAKLRIGEAKPDLSDRKRSSESAIEGEPPAKRLKTTKEQKLEKKLKQRAKRSLKAKYAPDMTLVTSDNVESHRFWKLTADNHLIRPISMRPSHPLPPTTIPRLRKLSTATKSNPFKPTKQAPALKVKSTISTTKTPPTRARRTVIDPTRYGAQRLLFPIKHSKDVSSVALPPWEFDEMTKCWVRRFYNGEEIEEVVNSKSPRRTITPLLKPAGVSSSLPYTTSTTTPMPPQTAQTVSASTFTAPPPLAPTSPATSVLQTDEVALQLQAERERTLALMHGLLQTGWSVDLDEIEGNDDDDGVKTHEKSFVRFASEGLDEDGKELVNSESDADETDGESEEIASNARTDAEPVVEPVILVPSMHSVADEVMQIDERSSSPAMIAQTIIDDETQSSSEDDDSEDETIDQTQEAKETTEVHAAPVASAPAKSLKDMFAPREEEGDFSLFGNLADSGFDLDNLELESDDDAAPHPSQIAGPIAHTVIDDAPTSYTTPAAPLIFSTRDETIQFDPSIPLFFPIPPRLRDNYNYKKGAKPKDIFDLAKDNGWTGGFWRTATEDEIKQRWEDVKGDLTRQYKKRHREAVKKRRRGHGTTMADREAE